MSKHGSSDVTLGELAIGALIVLLMLVDIAAWATSLIHTVNAAVTLFILLTLLVGLEHIVWAYRKFDGFFKLENLLRDIIKPLIASSIATTLGVLFLVGLGVVFSITWVVIAWVLTSIGFFANNLKDSEQT